MLPTGEQHLLRRDGALGEVKAVVAELAAGLRSLSVGGPDLVQRYPDDRIAPYAAGIVLVPWPNRVADATWTLDGATQRLDVTEPATGNASHGLLRNTGYSVTDREEHAITLSATVFPQHGYPFLLQTSVRYELDDEGLTVTHGIVNAGDGRAPVAIGAHPYLRAGASSVDDLQIVVAADTRFEMDERHIPTVTRPVDGTDVDLRSGARAGDLAIDVCLTDLALIDGRYRHRLAAPDGVTTELWAEEDFAYTQVFTRPGFPGPDGEELAVAIEPMTAPANALNTGEGLRFLEPGEEWLATWGIRRLN
ncbi:aldose 1-epimerase family protein [Herbiconiux sp. L3-i23]|uniref:aldose 1-epimerase family protein n=1 Tax=Herbiconiux sp. L3-i23 TaxID=2905871 RepID=UPI00205D28C1|nr:aldose 1-epimerase family protein [Herbiconiux sp. L3-i23]BDI23770.1 aldose 1-epimerase [Herbiconiux sp. L3-i23]